MKCMLMMLLMVSTSACVTFEDAARSRFEAGKKEQMAEEARKSNREAGALIYEEQARTHRAIADTSFIGMVLATLLSGKDE